MTMNKRYIIPILTEYICLFAVIISESEDILFFAVLSVGYLINILGGGIITFKPLRLITRGRR